MQTPPREGSTEAKQEGWSTSFVRASYRISVTPTGFTPENNRPSPSGNSICFESIYAVRPDAVPVNLTMPGLTESAGRKTSEGGWKD